MKKHAFHIFTVITVLFAVFTGGFFLGRNQNHESIHVTYLPTSAHFNLPPAENSVPESSSEPVSFPIDLNSAGMDELTALPGIGPTLAQRIMDFRKTNGPFSRPEELLNVNGIGAGKLEAILDYIITGG